jgi:hypothetical protein
VLVDIEYSTITGEGMIYAQGFLEPERRQVFQLDPWIPVGDDGWKTHNKTRTSFRKA